MPDDPDPRVCPSDGGDHDWQARVSALVCGSGVSYRITTGFCLKCKTCRTSTVGTDGSRTFEDEPA